MGTADTPAAPIKGLIGIDESRFINFASKTPDAVPMAKAITPRIRIPTVSRFKNWVASNLLPTPRPRKIVTALMSAFCMVSESRSTTPHSRARFPSMNIPIKGAADGSNKPHRTRTSKGNMIFSRRDTYRNCRISIFRSFSVVSSFMIGG